MAPVPNPSNIRAYVQWKEHAIYAGEEIECIITFKNEAPAGEEPLQLNGKPRDRRSQVKTPTTTTSRRTSITQSKTNFSRAPSISSSKGGPARAHRPTLSLNVVSSSLKGAGPPSATPTSAARGHGRSLSIMSLGSDSPADLRLPPTGSPKPGRGHSRSASLQFMPKPFPQQSTNSGTLSPRQPSPLAEATTPPALPESLPVRPSPRRPGTAPARHTARLGSHPSSRQLSSGRLNTDFQFPAQGSIARGPSPPKPRRTPSTMHSGQLRGASPRRSEGSVGTTHQLSTASRAISGSSVNDETPRTSGEFYSTSNRSDETLTSEMPNQAQQSTRLIAAVASSRKPQNGKHSAPSTTSKPETLMMGYVQAMGHFVLDGSLVNAAPFEEVKRKGVQSGGGVIGVERSKRSSGVFGAFSWGNLGESLGGLLGGDEMSSMAQLKATAGTKSIPLLSTPQSLLFVDLTLAPGEAKSYTYSFPLPRGLPPTHRGRAIKINYHICLGIQRPQGQAVKQVEVPFRVLGSYNLRGEPQGHDLMSPNVFLQDLARTAALSQETPLPQNVFPLKDQRKKVRSPQQGLEDFLRYTERLLEQGQEENAVILSPTSPTSPTLPDHRRRRSSAVEQPSSITIREAIDMAVLRSNHVLSSARRNGADGRSANRFNITRSGQPVAILTVVRPAYRLGESVTGVVDFTNHPNDAAENVEAPTYAVVVELESAERVDASLALRSSTSIHRVTRRVYAATKQNTVFSRHVSFSLAIPSTAGPTFETTGVSHTWRLRVEFTTQRQERGLGIEGQGLSDSEMLEEVGRDERGATLIAREHLPAETFEVTVPLKIFGAAGLDGIANHSEGLEV